MAESVTRLLPGTYNPPTLYRGDSWLKKFTLTRPDSSPIDLTGVILLMQVRENPDDRRVWVALGNDNGLTIGGTYNNEITLSTIINIPAGKYVYDIQFTFPDGRVKTYIAGKITVQGDVSRS